MNLFIDTNVFLSFYHLTSDDLEELRKLSVLLEKGDINLFLTDQVFEEFKRNRENKIAEAIKKLKDQRLNLQFPQLCKDYVDYPLLRGFQQKYEAAHASLVKNIIEDVERKTLKADVIIEELFAKARRIETTGELVGQAHFRMNVGNPPGKNGSLGDAINWEALLKVVPHGEELVFVADDKDYYSPLDEDKPKEFLLWEWDFVKDANITFYRRLSLFFKEHFPSIKLASELEKDLLIRMLAASAAFTTTHSVIATLSKYAEFNASQINEIIDAVLSNNQISWIVCDADVFDFVTNIVDNHKEKIDESNLEEIKRVLERCEVEEEEEENTQN